MCIERATALLTEFLVRPPQLAHWGTQCSRTQKLCQDQRLLFRCQLSLNSYEMRRKSLYTRLLHMKCFHIHLFIAIPSALSDTKSWNQTPKKSSRTHFLPRRPSFYANEARTGLHFLWAGWELLTFYTRCNRGGCRRVPNRGVAWVITLLHGCHGKGLLITITFLWVRVSFRSSKQCVSAIQIFKCHGTDKYIECECQTK